MAKANTPNGSADLHEDAGSRRQQRASAKLGGRSEQDQSAQH